MEWGCCKRHPSLETKHQSPARLSMLYIYINVRRISVYFIILLFMYLMWNYMALSRQPLDVFIDTTHTTQETMLRDSQWIQLLNCSIKKQLYPFVNELCYTFYRFVDSVTQSIHSNATWFALSLLNESYEAIDPMVISEELEDKLYQQLMVENIRIEMGGYYSPNGTINPVNCAAVNKTLVILIPYRNRAQNLIRFLSFMHRYLPLKSVTYRVVVLEQINLKAFNRAKLFNAGLRELGVLIEEGKRPFWEDNSTSNNCTSQCFILHDVDKLPASMHTPYECHDRPWQLVRVAVAPNRSAGVRGNFILHQGEGERTLYTQFFGGVTMVNKRVILMVNGMSNVFYGWGGEDDDFRGRMKRRRIKVHMVPLNYSRYYYMDHAADSSFNKHLFTLLSGNRILVRMQNDGIRQTTYTVLSRVVRPLYTLYQIII